MSAPCRNFGCPRPRVCSASVTTRSAAGFARAQASGPEDPSAVGRSARNKFVGLVTDVVADKVMAQVEMQCGAHRVVSLMSTEAVRELGLRPGVLAVAVVKATTVVVETPEGNR